MSSSYNNSIPSSSTQPFPLFGAATGPSSFNSEEMAMAMPQQPNSVSPPPPPPPAPKKRRNQPGNPSPDAQVIALSSETIMAANRVVCEVCNKGFQRKQNLELHRRGHNLPWNLRGISDKDARKKVYVCPEPTCVHHNPSRALGDLTGIKKHYYRKHCEKKFKCEKCSKCYAVQSDYKAHSRICGTKVYQCDCGVNFPRKDSYITHMTFCDAAIQAPAINPTVSFTEMAAAAGDIPGFYSGSSSSALSRNHFGNNSNTGFTPLAAGHNLNRPSSQNFIPTQSTNPNLGPANFSMQYPPNQGMLAQNNQNLMNQRGLTSLGDNNNNNLFNRYFQDNNNSGVPCRFNNADNNDPSALFRGLSFSPSSSVVANNFGGSGNGNFQGLMNSLAPTTSHQGRSGSSMFDHRFGNNLSVGGTGSSQTLDFLGVNGRGGGNGPPLDVGMKFSDPNNPFGKA